MQKRNFVLFHLFFRYDLDGYFLASFLMKSCMYKPRTTFSQYLFDLVIVENVSITSCLQDSILPILFLLHACEVKLSHLILGKDKLERVKWRRIKLFSFDYISYEDSCKIMHPLMSFWVLFFVDVKLFSNKTVKVDLQLCFIGRTWIIVRLAEHLPFITQQFFVCCHKVLKLRSLHGLSKWWQWLCLFERHRMHLRAKLGSFLTRQFRLKVTKFRCKWTYGRKWPHESGSLYKLRTWFLNHDVAVLFKIILVEEDVRARDGTL